MGLSRHQAHSHTAPDQHPALDSLVQELAAYGRQAAAAGGPTHDVEHGIWTRRAYLPGTNAVEVLDLLHVTPRLTGRLEIGLPSRLRSGLPYQHDHHTEALPE